MINFLNICKVDIAIGVIDRKVCDNITPKLQELYKSGAKDINTFDIWNYPSLKNDEDLLIIKNKMLECANSLWLQNSNVQKNITVRHAWFNNYDGWGLAPHFHLPAVMTGVCYLQAEIGRAHV